MSRYCMKDGKAAADKVGAAQGAGLRGIAVTDHVDFNPADEGCGFYRPAEHVAAVEAARAEYPKLEILAGLEIGEPHRYPQEF